MRRSSPEANKSRRVCSRRNWCVPAFFFFGLMAVLGCQDQAERALRIQNDARWEHVHGGIVRGDTSRPVLALVFTGGDYGEGTEHILTTLRQFNIKASFFLTGSFMASPERRALVKRMHKEGHYVGPHSHSHPLYCAWEDRSRTLVNEEFFRDDLSRNIKELQEIGALQDGRPIFFIPPYEWYNEDQVRWANQMGVVLFNFTPGSGSNRDWIPEGQAGFVPGDVILRDILAYEERDPHGLNGFLLLLHLGAQRHDKVYLHLGSLIEQLQRRGYSFARVDEMLTK
ncbi:MAG: polysaccharide deacetylase family protein [candidate division KSB1 bacterium]|nr:polysaccharide deacetylase family protein [candidate division KSB1 bacterium]